MLILTYRNSHYFVFPFSFLFCFRFFAIEKSPTPSDGRPTESHHRQEDNQFLADQSEEAATFGSVPEDASGGSTDDDDEGERERDLDEEMEDRDVSYISEDGSG